MSKIILTQGLPGSGKSFWSKQYCKKNKNYVRINRDDLREMRGEYWIPKQEGLITKWEQTCAKIALVEGCSVIIDSTNLNPKYHQSWKDLAKECNAELSWNKDFLDVPLEEVYKRNLNRERSVPESVIRDMYYKYIWKKPEQNPGILTNSAVKPIAVVCDVDGTLAKMTDRKPYDWDLVKQDQVITPVALALDSLREFGLKVIIFTGRDGSCEQLTKEWLEENKIEYDDFRIRNAGDMRKDSIVKTEMYEDIKHKYNVIYAIDDRKQVKRMWNELGVFVFDVNQYDIDF